MQPASEDEKPESPYALQLQLREVFNLLPESGEKDETNRYESEYIEILLQKLENLLTKASITNQLRKAITFAFTESMHYGKNEFTDPEENWFFFLDATNPNSEGIFSSQKAKEIEKIAYNREKRSLDSANKAAEHLKQKYGKSLLKPQTYETLDKWREDYKKVYGETFIEY